MGASITTPNINNNNNLPLTNSTTTNPLNLLSLREVHGRKEESDGDDDDDTVSVDSNRVQEALNRKNPEKLQEESGAVATVLPEEVLESAESDIFWAPDPETGVFVPAEEGEVDVNTRLPAPPHPSGITNGSGSSKGNGNGNGSTVLEETVWVREVEVEEIVRPPPIETETDDSDLL
ncbi:uncharacterized protein LOC109726940 isoform X2 [Ananas comosus]|uniref:Uncharacterized protein LOC109726940 isoform X2 n=1 Tax=Ananas comosus TaxID=4615 RepID=A0A6P5H3K5_ANACO|nr:uncharacterized protein LOC109726940 isoform X2 [Ananas comosus]